MRLSLLLRQKVNMSCIIESMKRNAAYKAVNNHVESGQIIGIGSGSTVAYAIERLAERFKEEKLDIKCVPTSLRTKQLIIANKLPLTDLESNPKVHICIDGADEVDSNLNLIKGGGGCLLQEKVVASCAYGLIIIADYRKDSVHLGEQYKKGIPIEVVPMAHVPVALKIERLFGGKASLRMTKGKAAPFVTENGNFILDWKDPHSLNVLKPRNITWDEFNKQILVIPGVVETGLFVQMAVIAYFGQNKGVVIERTANVPCRI